MVTEICSEGCKGETSVSESVRSSSAVVRHASDRIQAKIVFCGVFLWLLARAPGIGHYLVNHDHAYQLSLGQMVANGAWPFIDYFVHHGPLTSLVSALGLLVSRSLLGETVICALGYATAVCLMGLIVTQLTRSAWGWTSSVLGFLLISRFYKWWYWLWPLAVLWALSKYLACGAAQGRVSRSILTSRRGWMTIAGCLAGMGALFRSEFSVVFLLAAAAAVAIREGDRRETAGRGRDILGFAAGFAIPVSCWLLAQACHGGWSAVRDYFVGGFAGMHDAAVFWNTTFPVFRLDRLASLQSAQSVVMFVGFPVVYGGALILWAFRSATGRSEGPAADTDRFVATSSVMGVALLPQAFYRPDVHHLLQVLPVFVVTVLVLGGHLLRGGWGTPRSRRPLYRGLLVSLALVGLLPLIPIIPYGQRDMAPWKEPIDVRFRSIVGFPSDHDLRADWLSPVMTVQANEMAGLVSEIRTRTSPNERILVLGLAPQVYLFSQRPMSGVVNFYTVHQFFSDSEWRQRTLRHMTLHPPSVVAVERSVWELPGFDRLKTAHPEVVEYVSQHFTVVEFSSTRWMLLSPGGEPAGPSLREPTRSERFLDSMEPEK